MEQVHDLLITCYVNIAVVNTRAKKYALVIEACDEVLRLTPNHTKALFLRSKAFVTPKSAGTTEDEMAIKDLKLALKFEPDNIILQ